MVEDLFDDDLPIARKSVIPGVGFFVSSDEPTERADVASAEVVVLADPDADGLTAFALVEAHHGEATLVPTEPHHLTAALESVAHEIDEATHVYVLDLCPDDDDAIEGDVSALTDAATVIWYDHHQWSPDVEQTVRAAGVDLVVGPSDEVCTADVALEELETPFDDQWHDLVAVVRDHDLWLREDPRSDDLADYAHWTDRTTFIETIAEHGANLPEDAQQLLTERRIEKQALIDAAVNRAEFTDLGDITVAITYGRCSQNEVAETLRDDGADAVVVIKPSGGISLRGSEQFDRCHEVAGRLGGGGHPEAAGCKPDVFDDLVDYAHHWTTHGATARHAILRAFRDVVDESR